LSSRSSAIAGYGFCLGEGKSQDGDYRILEALSAATGVTIDTWHVHDDTGLFMAVAFTETDWDKPAKLNVTLPEGADAKLRLALGQLWEKHGELAKRFKVPTIEAAKFDWFLYTYHW
jgi:hypothetical protein